MDKIHGFPQDRCMEICSDWINCIAFNQQQMRCIIDMIVERLCNFQGIASLMLHEGKCKPYETLLNNAIKDLQIVSDWIRSLQNFNGNGKKDRRESPRFNTKEALAKINEQEYAISNISLTGCFIKTDISYPAGITIAMELIIGGFEIALTAKVVHSTDSGIGVKFRAMDKANEQKFFSAMADFFLQPINSLQKGGIS